MALNVTECVDKRLCGTWRFPNMETYKLVKKLSKYTSLHYIVCWSPSTSIWIYSHHIPHFNIVLQLPVLRTIFTCNSWVMPLVAAVAMLQSTKWCVQHCCISGDCALDGKDVFYLNFYLVAPCWGIYMAIICCHRHGVGDDKEKKWEVLRNGWLAWSQNRICNGKLLSSTHTNPTAHSCSLQGLSMIMRFAVS